MSMMLSISCLLIAITLLGIISNVRKLEKRINVIERATITLVMEYIINNSTGSSRKKLVGTLGEDIVNAVDKKLKENLDSEVKA